MFIIKNKKFFIGLSIALVVASIAMIASRGLNFGIEFTGGSVLEMSYQDRPDINEIKTSVAEAGFDAQVQPFGEDGIIVRIADVSEEDRKSLITAASLGDSAAVVERFNSIGPSVGKELRTKSLYALIAVSLGIVFFVAYAFRRVSKPVSSWRYGFVAVMALLHDILIPVGILTVLGAEVNTLYVVGLLSILGLSVNDTIVVFDRIRENLADNEESRKFESFDETVGNSITQTIARSIFTSLTLVVVLVALYFAGPVATRGLSLVLLMGTVVGTYSSIFLASPLLTLLQTKKKS